MGFESPEYEIFPGFLETLFLPDIISIGVIQGQMPLNGKNLADLKWHVCQTPPTTYLILYVSALDSRSLRRTYIFTPWL